MEICIVGGFPRAGTRQFTDILNKHGRVSIKGEFYPKVIRSLLSTFRVADEVNSSRWTNENYNKWRMVSALNAYAAFSKGSNSPFDFQGLEVAGFKCPRAEVFFSDIKQLIGFEKVVFFYCVRNVEDNFLSENSTFGVTVEDYVSKSIESMRSGLDISQYADVEFKVLSLDSYLASTDKSSWVVENIFSNFNSLNIDISEVRGVVEKVENTNATVRHGKVRRQKLTREEYEYIYTSSDFLRLAEIFEKKYEIELLG